MQKQFLIAFFFSLACFVGGYYLTTVSSVQLVHVAAVSGIVFASMIIHAAMVAVYQRIRRIKFRTKFFTFLLVVAVAGLYLYANYGNELKSLIG